MGGFKTFIIIFLLFIMGDTLLATSVVDLSLAPPTSSHVMISRQTLSGEEEKTFSLDGIVDGPTVIIYSNGVVAKRGHYAMGAMVGEWERFSLEGKLLDRGTWKEGRPDGEWETFYSNGVARDSGSYELGKKDGHWEYRNEDGSIVSCGHYRKGIKVGFWKNFEKKENEKGKEPLPKIINFKHKFGDFVEQHSLSVDLSGGKEILIIEGADEKKTTFFSDSVAQVTLNWSFDYGNDFLLKIILSYRNVIYSGSKEVGEIIEVEQSDSDRGQFGLILETVYGFSERQKFVGKLSFEERSFVTAFNTFLPAEDRYNVKIDKRVVPIAIGEWEYRVYKKNGYGLYFNVGLGLGPEQYFDDDFYFSPATFYDFGLKNSYQMALRHKFECKLYYTNISTRTKFKDNPVFTDSAMVDVGLGGSYVFEI